jgi:CheY-like chemotaxis protein
MNSDTPVFEKLSILIVEDDKNSKTLFSIFFANNCRELFNAGNGNDALETLKNNPGIDLILMDISLPEENGLVLTQKIRKFNKTVIIIAQTANALPGMREKAIEAGCNDFISKPIRKLELFDLIQKNLKIKSN